MRQLQSALVAVGFTAGLLMGIMAFLVARDLTQLQRAGAAVPQPMRVAELTEKGPGENLYVQLTDFQFGPPIIEKTNEQWKCVWLPLLPTGAAPKAQAKIFLKATDLEDQAQLDNFVKQTTLQVLVTNPLSAKSLFKVMPSETLRKADPTVEKAKATLLAQPRLYLAGTPILMDGELFDAVYVFSGWGVASGGFVLVFLSIYWTWNFKAPASALTPEQEAQRAALEGQQVLSVHPLQYFAWFRHSWQLWVGPILFFIIILGLPRMLGMLVEPRTGMPDDVVGQCAVGILGLLGAWACLAWAIDKLQRSPGEVIVYDGGLRWRLGSQWEAALWSDIKSVSRGETKTFRRGQAIGQSGNFTITLRDNRVLRFQLDVFLDYTTLANIVQTAAEEVVKRDKQRELAAGGMVEFGPISVGPDGLVIQGGWLWNDRHVPWDNIERFKVVNGHLVIHLRQAWFFRSISLKLADIPDYLPLLDFLQSGRGQCLDRSLNNAIAWPDES